MADDEDWDDFADAPDTEIARPTVAELAEEEAAPRPVDRERDQTTGRYRTLQGFDVARETTERIALERGRVDGRTTERTFLLAALRFYLLERGGHPDAADRIVVSLHAWVRQPENQRLVEAALGWDKQPPRHPG